MKCPIAIEPGDTVHAFGVTVPDLPGCFSASDTLDEALDKAKEAIELWLETVIDDGGAVPEPHPIAEHQANPEFAGWIWAVVGVDLAQLSVNTSTTSATENHHSSLCQNRRLTAVPGVSHIPQSPLDFLSLPICIVTAEICR